MQRNLFKIISLGFIVLLSLNIYPKTPQGGQFLFMGDFPLSFRNSFFSSFLNPASVKEYDRIDIKSIIGTLDNETMIGAGIGFPTLIGSFGFNALYFSADQGLTGLIGGGVYYSKEIAEDFFFGLGAKFFSIKAAGENKIFMNADVGVTYRNIIGSIPMEWGLSFVNLGPSAKTGDTVYPPMGLRLEVQPEFALIDKNNTTKPFIAWVFDFYPLGTILSLGVEQKLLSILNLGAGVSFDVGGDNYKRLGAIFVAVGAGYDFGSFEIAGNYTLYPMADFNLDDKTEMKHLFYINIKIGSVDKKGPEIILSPYNLIESDKIIYLSPNGDGINDTLSFGMELRDFSMVKEWSFSIVDSSGKAVYEKGGAITKDKIGVAAFSNIFRSKKEVFYPTEIIWPCIDSQGQKLPDGKYYYKLSAKDFKDNVTELPVQYMIIDTIPPKLTVSIPYKEFSPISEKKNFLILEHKDINKEAKWNIEIRSNGSPVFRKHWETKPDSIIKWDGKNEDGKLLPDGKYEYYIKAEDKAGNSWETVITDIIIDTKIPTVKASAGDNYFSPNGDGIKDTIEVEQEVSKEGEWTGEIVDMNGNVVRTFKWQKFPPKVMKWDGQDDNKKVLPDGKYNYRLKGVDKAGNKMEQDLAILIIDNTKPTAEVTIPDLYFSPNEDGEKDLLKILIKKSSEEDLWIGEIRDEKKNVVRSFTWKGTPTEALEWDGLDQEGKKLPDGKYSFLLSAVDRAGNSFKTEIMDIVLKTTPPVTELVIKDPIFSPAKESRKNTTTLEITVKDAVESSLDIIDKSGKVIKSVKVGPDMRQFIWDGRDDQGKNIVDGNYQVVLKAKDIAGNKNQAKGQVTVLTILSKINISGDRTIINPKIKEYSTINIKTEIPSIELIEKIEVTLVDKDESKVFSKKLDSKLKVPQFAYAFDGKVDGANLEDGEYKEYITVTYSNGDVIKSNNVIFQVDQTGPMADLKKDPEYFSPDGDGIDDLLNIHLTATDPSGIATWKIVIEDRFKENFKVFTGQNTIPELIQWDGKNTAGELTDSAEDYFIYAVITDNVGNTTETDKLPFTVDILVMKTDRGYKIRISNIEFDLNKATLKPSAIKILEKVGEKLKKFSQYKIKIEGHADSTGAADWNEKLSLMRADSVKDHLANVEKIEPERMTTEGYGSRIPLYPNNSKKNRAKNRRVEFILIK